MCVNFCINITNILRYAQPCVCIFQYSWTNSEVFWQRVGTWLLKKLFLYGKQNALLHFFYTLHPFFEPNDQCFDHEKAKTTLFSPINYSFFPQLFAKKEKVINCRNHQVNILMKTLKQSHFSPSRFSAANCWYQMTIIQKWKKTAYQQTLCVCLLKHLNKCASSEVTQNTFFLDA